MAKHVAGITVTMTIIVRVEGKFDDNVRMMLTGQVFIVMSGIATKEQVKEITVAVDKYLYDAAVGGYKLNTDFHEVKTDLGRMFGFAYGHKENGAVFSHMAIMYANALYQRGFIKEGYKVIETLYKHCTNFNASRIYPGVPEYINTRGRGMYHYLTGAASWLMYTVVTEMFGVKGELGDLVLQPKLLLEQFDQDNKVSIAFTYDGRQFEVTYINNGNKPSNECEIESVYFNEWPYIIDGNKVVIKRNMIEELDTGKQYKIKVVLN